MNSCRFPHIPAALLALLIAPACTADKGGSTDATGSSSGDGDTSTSTDPGVLTGGVLTSTSGPTTDANTEPGVTSTSVTEGTTDTSASSGPVSATGTTGEPEVSCAEEPLYFPDFDRSCMIDADCSLVIHQIDCCGNGLAWGINNDEAKAFGAAEAMCSAQYPACGCPAMPPVADDGNSAPDQNLILVLCVDDMCKTSVP